MNYTNAFRLVGSEADDGDDDDNREQPMGNKEKGKFCLHQFHRAAMVCAWIDGLEGKHISSNQSAVIPSTQWVKYCAMVHLCKGNVHSFFPQVEFFKNQKPAPLQGDDAGGGTS